jgi:hypothetical protein
MKLKNSIVAALLSVVIGGVSDAKQPRSTVERHAFVKAVACPATEKHRLPCPGWQIDHIEPLCAGGADQRSNMQWLTIEDHKAKTKQDVRACNALRKIQP